MSLLEEQQIRVSFIFAALSVQRSSIRILLTIAATLCATSSGYSIHKRYITQAYTQFETRITPPIFAPAAAEMRTHDGQLFKIVYNYMAFRNLELTVSTRTIDNTLSDCK